LERDVPVVEKALPKAKEGFVELCKKELGVDIKLDL